MPGDSHYESGTGDVCRGGPIRRSSAVWSTPSALSSEGSETLSVKIPAAMKRALTATADKENMTTSELVRAMLTKSLIDA